MTELRQQMNNAMRLRGLADRTRESYLLRVRVSQILSAATGTASMPQRSSPTSCTSSPRRSSLTPASIRRPVPSASCSAPSSGALRRGSTSRWPRCPNGCRKFCHASRLPASSRTARPCASARCWKPSTPPGCDSPRSAPWNCPTSKAPPTGCASKSARARAARIGIPCFHPGCSTPCVCTGAPIDRNAGCSRTGPATARSMIRPFNACIAPYATPPDCAKSGGVHTLAPRLCHPPP